MKSSLVPLSLISQKSSENTKLKYSPLPHIRNSGSYSPIFLQHIGLSYSPSKLIKTPNLSEKSSKLKRLSVSKLTPNNRQKFLTQRQEKDQKKLIITNKRIQDAIQVTRLLKNSIKLS